MPGQRAQRYREGSTDVSQHIGCALLAHFYLDCYHGVERYLEKSGWRFSTKAVRPSRASSVR
jgi:hypothetical protein